MNDPMYEDAKQFAESEEFANSDAKRYETRLQRRFRIGFRRAEALVEELIKNGVIIE